MGALIPVSKQQALPPISHGMGTGTTSQSTSMGKGLENDTLYAYVGSKPDQYSLMLSPSGP